MKIALLGAGGFLGSRLLESCSLLEQVEIVPIVRSPKGVARIARLGIPWKIANLQDTIEALQALSGCDIVINTTIGELGRMPEATSKIWHACSRLGVRRYVHLSTAEVFGRVESGEINDDSLPIRNHWMPYARAKIATEEVLRPLVERSSIDTVILRPGLIWGPKSPWVEGPVSDMLAGRAILANRGLGICNLIYIDNLVQQILSVCQAPERRSGFYNVSDDGETRWIDYYRSLARVIGLSEEQIALSQRSDYTIRLEDRLFVLKSGVLAEWIKGNLSRSTKRSLKQIVNAITTIRVSKRTNAVNCPEPRLNRVSWHQQSVVHKLSNKKFRNAFGKAGEIDYSEAMQRTADWIRFSGYSDPLDLGIHLK